MDEHQANNNTRNVAATIATDVSESETLQLLAMDNRQFLDGLVHPLKWPNSGTHCTFPHCAAFTWVRNHIRNDCSHIRAQQPCHYALCLRARGLCGGYQGTLLRMDQVPFLQLWEHSSKCSTPAGHQCATRHCAVFTRLRHHMHHHCLHSPQTPCNNPLCRRVRELQPESCPVQQKKPPSKQDQQEPPGSTQIQLSFCSPI